MGAGSASRGERESTFRREHGQPPGESYALWGEKLAIPGFSGPFDWVSIRALTEYTNGLEFGWSSVHTVAAAKVFLVFPLGDWFLWPLYLEMKPVGGIAVGPPHLNLLLQCTEDQSLKPQLLCVDPASC